MAPMLLVSAITARTRRMEDPMATLADYQASPELLFVAARNDNPARGSERRLADPRARRAFAARAAARAGGVASLAVVLLGHAHLASPHRANPAKRASVTL
jgi:hypothetical protein